MLSVKSLYRPFHLSNRYEDLHEEKILSSLFKYQQGSVELIISRLINEAILNHMHLCIDSTIMQVLELSEYLSKLFITNFKLLMFNYLIDQLEARGIEEIDEAQVVEIEVLAQSVKMKTELRQLQNELDVLIRKKE
ncbi:MAG: hypothetical protein E7231_11570 [Cellulosilyticum sp.]|nr:hypothetical protein [Cellulosilyticum sp.]